MAPIFLSDVDFSLFPLLLVSKELNISGRSFFLSNSFFFFFFSLFTGVELCEKHLVEEWR